MGTILIMSICQGGVYQSRCLPMHNKENHSWSPFLTLIPTGEDGDSTEEPYLCLRELRHSGGESSFL